MIDLLNAAEWRQIDRLALSAPSPVASALHGARRARHRGAGVEFHEYREYEPGDDLRDVDWTVYGRLERLFIRLTRAEAPLTTHVLLDASGSMGIGRPSKLTIARKVAAAVTRVALASHEPVALGMLATPPVIVPPGRTRGHAGRILDLLGRIDAAGETTLSDALIAYADVMRTPGLAVVITDAFTEDAGRRGLAYLSHRGFDVTLLHVLAEEDLDPDLSGVEIVDAEAKGGAAVAIDATMVAAYRERVGEHVERLSVFCTSLGMRYMRVLSHVGFEGFVLDAVRAGLWRPRA